MINWGSAILGAASSLLVSMFMLKTGKQMFAIEFPFFTGHENKSD